MDIQENNLTYNTHLAHLKLPEYGRTVQKMIDHCKTLEDREQRNACAQTIIGVMNELFNENKNDEESMRKLWDHLAIMADFDLDIDWPFEVIKKEDIEPKPQRLSYETTEPAMRQYGRTVFAMIDKACSIPPSHERDTMVWLIANQMKKAVVAWSDTDSVEDERIFKDIASMSDGELIYDASEMPLCEYADAPSTGKKKKKK